MHTKARNRLHAQTVHMLLFTYINLRLLNKCEKDLGHFKLQCLEEVADEDQNESFEGLDNN